VGLLLPHPYSFPVQRKDLLKQWSTDLEFVSAELGIEPTTYGMLTQVLYH
jgi:hypothetical protein